jgi:hypothetical protein
MADNLRGNITARERVLSGSLKSGDNGFSANVPGSLDLHYARNGATFTPDVSDDGILSWTNDQNLANPAPVDIRGPAGPQGERGLQGIQGPQGIQGQQGPAGQDGRDGKDGADGKDGYTPIRGTDYWTEADKREIVEEVAASIPNSASPDWNANEGDAGYIQNRTHWISSGFEQIYNGVPPWYQVEDYYIYNGVALNKYPNAGTVPEYVDVFIDGVKYECPVAYYASADLNQLEGYKVSVGNDYMAFTTTYRGYNVLIVLCTEGLTDKVFTIGYDGDFYHTLDERYIPNTIARTADIPQMWEIIDNVIAALPRYNGEVADV